MDFSTENDTLSRISKALYGDALTLAVMDPKDISLLKKNARILKKDVFQQLTANIGRDKRLSSVPLCHRLSDGRVEVLSGNHRVQASVEAGIERILVMIIEEDLTRSQAVAIQLSHNALVGEDDPALLAELWAEIEDIAAKTYAGLSSDVVEKLDKGWDSDVGEGGGRLSTGQKQLISFARAVLADPRIFVLDEATSSIDTQTEQLIQQAIDHLLRDRTSFLIAHRLSTIRKADMILVVRDGRIVEQGTHQELLRRRGYYHDLYSKQFAEESAARILQ